MDKNITKNLNMNSIDIMKVETEYTKLFKKANIAEKFELRCWIDYCRNIKVIEFQTFLNMQTLHNFLDRLNYDLVDIDGIGSKEDIEMALSELF